MMNLLNRGISYMIISSKSINDIASVLYAKEYSLYYIKTYHGGHYGDSIIAQSNIDNDMLRKDAIFLMSNFHIDPIIIKYFGEDICKKIHPDGSEELLKLLMYNTDSNNLSYIMDGISFSFIRENRYWKPKTSSDFKIGMIVEYYQKDKWLEYKITNPHSEYEDMFKLLIKYDKVRVAS